MWETPSTPSLTPHYYICGPSPYFLRCPCCSNTHSTSRKFEGVLSSAGTECLLSAVSLLLTRLWHGVWIWFSLCKMTYLSRICLPHFWLAKKLPCYSWKITKWNVRTTFSLLFLILTAKGVFCVFQALQLHKHNSNYFLYCSALQVGLPSALLILLRR